MKKYVAYYRVSTKQQGRSGLGLEAQKSTIIKFISDGELIGEFTDIESGTRKGNNKRDEMLKAISLCKTENAILLIAKLDRLSRNVSFITTLMESGIEFIACDMPHANKFTIHVFAALAEQEADMISLRVKEALLELKKKGIKLGKPENLTDNARKKGCEIRMKSAINNENNSKAEAFIRSLRANGISIQKITDELNRLGFQTSRGFKFHPNQVMRLSKRLK